MPFDLTALLDKEIGLAAALLFAILFFLNHIEKRGREETANVESLIREFNSRIKELIEINDRRLSESNANSQRIVEIITTSNAARVKDLCESHEKLASLVTSSLQEVVRINEHTQMIIESRTVRQIEHTKGDNP